MASWVLNCLKSNREEEFKVPLIGRQGAADAIAWRRNPGKEQAGGEGVKAAVLDTWNCVGQEDFWRLGSQSAGHKRVW